MHFLITYFSGTGNTEWVTRKLVRRFHTFNHTTRVVSVESVGDGYFEPELSDMIGLLFPVHSSYPPKNVEDFLKRLPPVINQPLFAITTSAYMAGDTAWKAVQPLKAIGYDPVVTDNVIMPNNYYLPPVDIQPVTPPERIPKILERAAKRIDRIAVRIQKARRRLWGRGPAGRLLGTQQRWSYRTFEPWINRGFIADENCTKCGWCVRHCPAHNIRLAEKCAEFLDRCLLCLRCYSFCPEKAVQMTTKTRNLKRYRRYSGPEGKSFPAPASSDSGQNLLENT